MHLPRSFTAPIVSGSGRGRKLGLATMNVDVASVPADLEEGIYACFAMMNGKRYQAAMHYGPRPVFKDSATCEIHILDAVIKKAPKDVTVVVMSYLREVRNFPSVEDMMRQIEDDIRKTRGILSSYESTTNKTADS